MNGNDFLFLLMRLWNLNFIFILFRGIFLFLFY